MKPLKPPACHHLNAAQGWLMLGDAQSAGDELRQLPPSTATLPEVLEARWQFHALKQEWPSAIEIGEQMVRLAPEDESGWIHRSYALHELRQTSKAKELLRPAVGRFPRNGIIRYNLACYTTRLGETDEALRWIREASRLLGRQKVLWMVQDDEDLRAIREEIELMLKL